MRGREIQAIVGQTFVPKDVFLAEMRNLQEILYKEIDLKVQDVERREDRPSSRLKSDLMMNNAQYKKILELMLDLEKKMDKRFLEAHHETATAILNALDVT